MAAPSPSARKIWETRADDAMRSFGEERARLAAEVSRIKCPTLVVRGALSDVPTDGAAEKFARSLSNGRWVRIEKFRAQRAGRQPARPARRDADILPQKCELTGDPRFSCELDIEVLW